MRRSWVFLAAMLGAGCATLADGHSGLDSPPSARTGPFRILKPGEIGYGRPAPFAMGDKKALYRDPAVLDLDGDPSTFAIAGYFAANIDAPPDAKPDRIVRATADDGRSFTPQQPLEVLAPSLAWEKGTVGAPSVVAHGAEVRLYYAAGGGIGLARSADGVTFDKEADPVLRDGAAAWAQGAPRSPSVIELPDHTFRLFFEADSSRGPAIGEAESVDGVAWQVIGSSPAIDAGSALDAAGASSPYAVLRASEEGRPILDVYYTAIAADGSHAVGLASRFADASHSHDALERSPSSMLTPNAALLIREPCVVRFASLTFLFATENSSKTSSDAAVIVAVAPPLETLPPAPN